MQGDIYFIVQRTTGTGWMDCSHQMIDFKTAEDYMTSNYKIWYIDGADKTYIYRILKVEIMATYGNTKGF